MQLASVAEVKDRLSEPPDPVLKLAESERKVSHGASQR